MLMTAVACICTLVPYIACGDITTGMHDGGRRAVGQRAVLLHVAHRRRHRALEVLAVLLLGRRGTQSAPSKLAADTAPCVRDDPQRGLVLVARDLGAVDEARAVDVGERARSCVNRNVLVDGVGRGEVDDDSSGRRRRRSSCRSADPSSRRAAAIRGRALRGTHSSYCSRYCRCSGLSPVRLFGGSFPTSPKSSAASGSLSGSST